MSIQSANDVIPAAESTGAVGGAPQKSVMMRQKSCMGAFSTTTKDERPPIQVKPNLPVKPAHIRPGLKPVKIPNVEDKLLVRYFSFRRWIYSFVPTECPLDEILS